MSEEIKIGEYVRTKNGIIDEVIIKYNGKCNNTNCDKKHISCKNNYYDETEILKHSKNIIDLIEVGDYVNGHLVVELSENIYNQKLVITEVDGKDGAIRHYYLEKSIKTIVTREQMASIEYKVESE